MNITRRPAAPTALLWITLLRRQRRGMAVARALVIALLGLLLIVPGVGAEDAAFLTAPGGPWQHEDTTYFSINYLTRDAVAAQADLYKKIADPVYEMETNIFDGAQLVPRPVPLYLYTDVAQFTTAVPAALADQNLYSGVDGGGVYLCVPRMGTLKAPALTLDLRMLITQQIVTMMAGGNLPPGLLQGTALYGEAPPAELPALVATLSQQTAADHLADWATLFSSADSSLTGQQYSVVSFLIDTYGFRQYRDFLTELSKPEAGKDWRQAMQIVYKSEGSAAATSLEAKWKAYLPQFLGGLWQRNQFTYYNIDEATQLVGVGQYSQAVTLLTPAIGFLQQIGTPKRAADAQALLSKARAGSEAEARVRDAQQALEGNDYARTNDLLKQAADLYKAVPDAKPPLLLVQYQQRAARGVQATNQLNTAEAQINGWNVIRARQNANRAFGTFTEFGNAPLANRAQTVIERANQRIRMAGVTVIGAGLVILLGGFALMTLRRGRRQRLPALPPLE
ncbi:MAG: hypothetical protein LC793_16595 [Thermomicrobia bacterium]|nr:hypothetical protein [Thermomicrobia bacterium]MCA1724894.1 hypothetical protein [Thermomicrobia bacterium]